MMNLFFKKANIEDLDRLVKDIQGYSIFNGSI